ncbi:PPPDE putative peptidase domain-containing protein, partial [Phakopsora pachyrhizi]
YDLSNGLARSMSMSWTERQFNGIWHTSVVFDNQLEVFFGQGIMTSRPGNSHIGKPLRVIDQGETMIDPVTFEDYIKGLRSSWNAQSFMSHSLELSSLRNCNSFSKEVLSFLNGSNVPDYILSLPHQFLSTPLGASMRPMIDQMFR